MTKGSTHTKSAAALKTCMLGFVTAAGLGFISLPAHAQNNAVIEQEANQSTAIVGNGNASISNSKQTANVLQRNNGSGFNLPDANDALIRQRVNQETGIAGDGNAVNTENRQDANVVQINGRRRPSFPSFPFHNKFLGK